jgi:hypothetical protein
MITREELETMAARPLGHFDVKAEARAVARGRGRVLPESLRINGSTSDLIRYVLDHQTLDGEGE